MYTIDYRKEKVIGTDDQGMEILLLDLSDVMKNKSAVPLRIVKKDAEGRFIAVETVWEEISRHFPAYKERFSSGEVALAMFITDLLMAGKLISSPKPVLTAVIDAKHNETDVLSKNAGWFDRENAALDIDSGGRNEIFREQGFDIVIVFADDSRAEEELRTVSYLLNEDGLLLIIARETRLYEHAAELYISDLSKIVIDSETAVFKAQGRKALRENMMETDIAASYKEICEHISTVIRDGGDVMETQREINRLVREAQGRWDLKMKQMLLDLKERFQMYVLNKDDRYAEEYRKELEEML